MNAYVDSSVILRLLFGEAEPLPDWARIRAAWTSRIAPVELARAIDRARLAGRIDDDAVAQLHSESARVLRSMDVLALDEAVLLRAAGAMPTSVGTLDAVHLASAIELLPHVADLVFATHDVQLARGARACGLPVVGA